MSRLFLFLSVVALLSCEKHVSKEVEVKKSSGIMGGTLVAENSLIASGIVGIYDAEEQSICTGSLIAENYVVTAGHCGTSKASKLKVVFGTDIFSVMGTHEPDILQEYVRRVTDVRVHPDYFKVDQENEPNDWGDIALIKFAGPLPAGYKPVPLLQDGSILTRGFVVTLAGYGVSQVDLEPVDAKKVPNLEEALESGDVVCDDNNKNCMKVEMSGDGELRETKAPISFLTRTEVRLDESKGHGTCAGDSGGPAYVEKDGKYYLFGVTSRGSALCSNTGVYTNVIYYQKWIKETMPTLR